MNMSLQAMRPAGSNFWSKLSARLVGWSKSFLDWRPVVVRLPRNKCHFLSLDARGVPTRMLAASVRLQLVQLTGLAKPGFVFQVGKDKDNKVTVWYWDEDGLEPAKLPELAQQTHLPALSAPSRRNTGFAPWPESLLRDMPGEGLRLLKLDQGYESLSIKGGEIHRTRWYAEAPDREKWAAFARDAGYSAQGETPAPERLPLLTQAPKSWKLHSAFLAPVSLRAWGLAAALVILGAGLLTAATYQVKLELAVSEAEREIERISTENASTIDLQSRIETQMEYLDQLRRAQPEALQLELMRTLDESGLIDPQGDTSLIEWEYRNKQLRLLFLVPQALALGEFLTKLENLPIFQEIRLLPDTPARTVGVQTVLAPWQPGVEPEAPTEAEAESAPPANANANADTDAAP